MKYFALATLFAVATARPMPQDEVAPSEPAPSGEPTPTPTPLPTVGLHPNGNAAKCVDVRGGILQAGTAVQIYDCNGTAAQKFSLARGDGQVVVTGTNYCLEPDGHWNGSPVRLKLCNKSLLQNWYYTDDDRLAVTGAGLCLDLTEGSDANGNGLQVWQCGDGNTNQVWTTNMLFR
ncbi:hypothetical protein CspeluHIS016_0105790 [Cutaneotrichosporon spelunceum]|uniref:Ricin B lectin domain-containing protein n=1 Tax=Cutaneotrichosporon spelunceum TaxID=1672016 RepID=A0AAD3Y9H7_9TREE|nr:hypothetical protein CspeluHIS016_0105790 [Cutaneotrichosporon spelunceum]